MKNNIPPIKIDDEIAQFLNKLKKEGYNISQYIRNLIIKDMKK